MLADPQETSAADLVWDTGSGCWGEGETGRLSWLPGQVEGILGLTPTLMPGRPLAAAENGHESAPQFPLPPTYSWRRETVRPSIGGRGGARLGSEGLNQDRNSLFPGDVCVCVGVRPGGLWGGLLLPPPSTHTHQLVWSPLYLPGTAGSAGMEWASGWEWRVGTGSVLCWSGEGHACDRVRVVVRVPPPW